MPPDEGPGFSRMRRTPAVRTIATLVPFPTNRGVMPKDRMIATLGESQLLLPRLVTGGLAGIARATSLLTMWTHA